MGFIVRRCLLLIPLVFLVVSPAVGAEGPAEEKASTCISCHRDLGGKLAEPVTLWEKSIHHQMGNSCEGCHGGDPGDPADAMSPAKGFVGAPKRHQIASFCGKCHVGVMENYQKSPHYAAALTGGGPNCVTCHHSHDVQRASFDLISEPLCSQCHSYENGQEMKKAFVTAELALQSTIAETHLLDRRGMPVKRLEEKLFALRNSLHQMTHTLGVAEIQNKSRQVLADVEEMKKETRSLHERIHRRWWGGVGVAAFLAVLVFALIRLLKSFEEEE